MRLQIFGIRFLTTLATAILVQPAAAQAPYGYHFTRTDENPTHVVYDSIHQQFFVSVPGKNEIIALSESDGATRGVIGIESPGALDMSPNFDYLYVGSSAADSPPADGSIVVIDTASLQMVNTVRAIVPLNPSDVYHLFDSLQRSAPIPILAAMRNGKLFLNTGVNGAGSLVAQYNPVSGACEPAPSLPDPALILSKDASASRFVAVTSLVGSTSPNGELWVYDSDSDSFIAHSSIPNVNFTNGTATFSPDGTRILANGHVLLDQHLNQIADIWPDYDYRDCYANAFSADSRRIYCFGGPLLTGPHGIVRVFDSSSGAVLGDVPAFDPSTEPWPSAMAVGASGKAVLLAARGFVLLDLNVPQASLGPVPPNFTLTSDVGSVSSSPGPTVFQMFSGYNYLPGSGFFFGNAPAKILSSLPGPFANTAVTVQPPLATPGAVDVSVSDPTGWASYSPQGYSYGPVILYQDTSAGSSAGGTTVNLIGYGFDNGGIMPAVTVGGTGATGISKPSGCGISYPFPIECLTFVTPPGPLGPADIMLTTLNGTFTESKGFSYISHTLIPGLVPYLMAVDNKRGQVYVADGATGNVVAVDVNTFVVSTLVSLPSNPATLICLTPDGSRLLIASTTAGTLTVFDLNTRTILNTFTFSLPSPVPGEQLTNLAPTAIAATSRGTALVGLAITDTTSGKVCEIDLRTGVATDISYQLSGVPNLMLFASSADGSIIYVAPSALAQSDGKLSVWSAALDSVIFQRFYEGGFLQLATTSSGDRVMAGLSTLSQALDQLTVPSPNDLLAASRSQSLGGKMNSTGSLQYLPTTNGVEIFDVNGGDMRLSVGLTGGVASLIDGLAVDSAGSTLFVSEASGLGIVKLGPAPLSIGKVLSASTPPASGARRVPPGRYSAGQIALFGSGFQQGATVSVGGVPVDTDFVSSTELTVMAPLLDRGHGRSDLPSPLGLAEQVSITVANPNGDSYTLPASYNPVPASTESQPAVTTASAPVGVIADDVVTVVGSGFVASSQISLDGIPVQTVYVDGEHLYAYLYTLATGAHSITVTNPDGRISKAQPLQIK